MTTSGAAMKWWALNREEIEPGHGRMESALLGFTAGLEAGLESSDLLAWLDMMCARVTWDSFALGTERESRQCCVSLRDYPFSATADSFLAAARTLRTMYESARRS